MTLIRGAERKKPGLRTLLLGYIALATLLGVAGTIAMVAMAPSGNWIGIGGPQGPYRAIWMLMSVYAVLLPLVAVAALVFAGRRAAEEKRDARLAMPASMPVD
jgi:uncharacterized membrane protein